MKDQKEEQRAFAEAVWQVVAMIPPGKVATYGQVAALARHPNQARRVGRVLSKLPAGSRLPWHRVISASGRITSPNSLEQSRRLRSEGVRVHQLGVRLEPVLWRP